VIDWNNVVSAVATSGGLAIVERRADGGLGAVRLIPQRPSAPPPFTAVPGRPSAGNRGPGTYAEVPPRQSAPPPFPPCPPGTHLVDGECVP
jgi:hypothetical protein